MSPRPYIGVAGITTRAEARACLGAFPPCDRPLALGVLVSAKTLRGETTRWHRRMPRVEDIAEIFPDDPRALNLIHYSSDEPIPRATLGRLSALMGPHGAGVQFNGAWPAPNDIAWAQRHGWPGFARVVLQVRSWLDSAALSALPERLAPYRGLTTDILLDASGGRGLVAAPIWSGVAVEYLRRALPDFGIGVAVGMCAATVPEVAVLLRAGVSIDAEGRLRDGADGGGNIMLDEVRAYLCAAAGCV